MAVGDHRRGVGSELAQAFGELGITGVGRGQHLDPRCVRFRGDGTAGQSPTTPGPGVRSRDDSHDLVCIAVQ